MASSTEILEHVQSKALRKKVGTPCLCQIWLSEEISKHQQLKKKSAATTLNTVLTLAHTQTT
jgi:hypothetical protein